MGQQKSYTSRKDVLKETLRLSSLTVLVLCGLNAKEVLSDNTFVINFVLPAENTSVELGTDKTAVKGKHVIEKTVTLTHPKEVNIEGVNLVQPQPPVQVQAQPPIQPQPPVQAQSLKPLKLETPPQTPVSSVAAKDDSNGAPSEKQKSLQLVQPHPKPLPIHEKEQISSAPKEQSAPQKALLSYSDVANDRSPVGLLDPTKEVHKQRWYLYSSAMRGLKESSENVHIVSTEKQEPKRGEEVKKLLVEMGIKPSKIKLIHTQGEESQAGGVYIFAGK